MCGVSMSTRCTRAHQRRTKLSPGVLFADGHFVLGSGLQRRRAASGGAGRRARSDHGRGGAHPEAAVAKAADSIIDSKYGVRH